MIRGAVGDELEAMLGALARHEMIVSTIPRQATNSPERLAASLETTLRRTRERYDGIDRRRPQTRITRSDVNLLRHFGVAWTR